MCSLPPESCVDLIEGQERFEIEAQNSNLEQEIVPTEPIPPLSKFQIFEGKINLAIRLTLLNKSKLEISRQTGIAIATLDA
jgi:hypothetical protein